MEIRILAPEGPEPDAAELCARVRALCRDGPDAVVCDVGAVAAPTLATVQALARAALTARRLGIPFRVTGATPALRALLHLVGLVELLGEPEEREPPGGVQEGIEPGDLPV
ncbi:STAS domain-containing protein [Streptomyces sp. NPDC006487]|uniref:STAS domain-containing protein n=1 Tax=Streptomyces sp. NPDC006487 TaxID=3364748 RepID=UPI0036BA66D9